MKIKNIKSAVHNFAHSLQSFDFTHSQVTAFHVLLETYLKSKNDFLRFDFINNIIYPNSQKGEMSTQLFKDYQDLLQDLFKSHNADLSRIEKLTINIQIKFDSYKVKPSFKNAIELETITNVCYKVYNKEENQIALKEVDMYGIQIFPKESHRYFFNWVNS